MRDEVRKRESGEGVKGKEGARLQPFARLRVFAFSRFPIFFTPLPLYPFTPGRSSLRLAALLICVALCASAPLAFAGDKTRASAERAMRDGEFQLAEKLFRELLAKDAHDNPARLGLSYALLKQRNLQDAFDHAARVVAIEPLSPRAHALLGASLLAGGDFQQSVEEFRTSLDIKDDEALAIAGLAMVEFYENRLDASLSGLRRAVYLDPREPDYTFSLAQVAARNERYKEAADAYERFLLIAPRSDTERRARIRGLIDFLRYLGTIGRLYEPGGEQRTIVTFQMIDTRPILQVRVNGGRDTLRFVLDTGSGMCVISDATAQRLGLRAVARGGQARAVGGVGRFEIVYGFLSSLDIGAVRVANVPVYIRHFFDEKNPVDGYIGLSVITKYLATVDYGNKTFTLIRQRGENASTQAASAIEIPTRTTSSGFLSGQVRLDGIEKPLSFIIDTGASISVISAALMSREDMSGYAQGPKMRVFGAAGVVEDVQTLTLSRLALGAHARQNVRAAVLDMDAVNETAGFLQAGIIGGNFLSHYRVTFDFQRAVIRLDPVSSGAVATETSTGIDNATSQP